MSLVDTLQSETEAAPERLMAALIKLAQGDEPLFLKEGDRPDLNSKPPRNDYERSERGDRGRGDRRSKPGKGRSKPDAGMQRFRIEVGHTHGAKPGNIVGAIANEANLKSKNIGAIEIYDTFSTVDLPDGMPEPTKDILRKARVAGQRLNLREWSDTPPKRKGGPKR